MANRVDGNHQEIAGPIKQMPGWEFTDLTQVRPSRKAQLGDGFLRARWWPPGLVLQLEFKRDNGRISPEQTVAASSGRIVIVRSFDEVKAAMDAIGRCLDKTNVKFGEDLRAPGVQPSQLRTER